MGIVFNADATTDEVLAGVDLSGKRVLVTGVSAGLGVETARALTAHGAEVIGTARDIEKAKAVTSAIANAKTPRSGKLVLLKLDLANIHNVCAGADWLDAQGRPIDLIIANAGVMATPFSLTADGFELQFGTNHLGHFVLVNRIQHLLRSGGRLVSVSSAGHRFANVDLQDPNFERTPYDPFVAYGRSKTANILFAVAFDSLHCARGVRACSVHPGGVKTELDRNIEPSQVAARLGQINRQLALERKGPFAYKMLAQGAATSVWAGVVASAEDIGGKYCENCHVSQVVPDGQEINVSSEGVRAYAVNPASAEALWRKSEELVEESLLRFSR